MPSFVLPQGSIVKFGCISTSLYSYLRHGIPSTIARDGLPVTENATENATEMKGIYIGELMAYFSACSAFARNASEVHVQHQAVLKEFVASLQRLTGEKPVMHELENIATQVGLPVILEIMLAEDCEVQADGHFEPEDKADKSWKLWRSVVLQRESGVPASWIKHFYFPRLLDYRDVGSAKNLRVLEQTTDSALMVGGLMQAWHKDAPGDLLLAFKKQYGRMNFSQSLSFDETNLERFFNLNGMLDPATRLLNQMTIWQDVDALAKKQGITLAV
ncbi:MAG: hypothetical protein K2P84_03420 [Undibacterium sp.]|nr:hypothetical protein [Undibacterium sp.]